MGCYLRKVNKTRPKRLTYIFIAIWYTKMHITTVYLVSLA